jgi:hypothetical protein
MYELQIKFNYTVVDSSILWTGTLNRLCHYLCADFWNDRIEIFINSNRIDSFVGIRKVFLLLYKYKNI